MFLGKKWKTLQEYDKGIRSVKNAEDIVIGIWTVNTRLGIAQVRVNGIVTVIPRMVTVKGARMVKSWRGIVKKLLNPLKMLPTWWKKLVTGLKNAMAEKINSHNKFSCWIKKIPLEGTRSLDF